MMTQLGRASVVVDGLQEWLDSHFSGGDVPLASFGYTASTLCIEIDDVTVWDSEIDRDEELNLGHCALQWVRHCTKLAAFAKQIPPADPETQALARQQVLNGEYLTTEEYVGEIKQRRATPQSKEG